uniref:Phosphatidylinositol-4-phosphate 3-kinase n=1 Tax=Panagrolaimus sp. ES5 TaxID=591445 RepID=A0AC34GT29_9BILA
MSIDAGDDDEQLRKAIELSKQTYNEEQRKRHNSSPEDLMGGDPDEIQRQRNIAEITALYNSPPGPSHSFGPGSFQHFEPRSNATLPYEYPELQFDEIIALLDKSNVQEEEPPVEPVPLPVSPKKKEVIIGKLKLIPGKNAFSKDCEQLEHFVEQLRNRKDLNVFFLAPTVDYYTTVAESIKLIIHRDETWPSGLKDCPNRIELTYDTSSTCEDLLITSLFRFLNPDDHNETLPTDDFTLKLYGTDEFLEPHAILGKHPIVGKFLSRGKDVELMIGKKIIRDVNYPIPDKYTPAVQGIEYKFPREVVTKMIVEINECFIGLDANKSYSKDLRQLLKEKVIDLCVTCHRLVIYDISSALTAFLAADIESHYKVAKDNFISAIHTMLTMYCEATYSNLTMESLTLSSPSEEKVNRESVTVEDEFLIQVESIHNLPLPWFQHYNSFYVEVVLMYGTKNICNTHQTDSRNFSQRYKNFSIMFQQWIKTNMAVMILPREAQVCLIVYGKRKINDSTPEADILGFASFPLFDRDGFLMQGKVAVPLKIQQHQVVEPWGPRPMIKNRGDVVIVLSTLEYGYNIQFPTVIEKEKITPVEFTTLSIKDQNTILDIIDNHDSLSQDDIHLLWSNRRALMQNPDAFIPTIAAATSWNALNLSNVYPLLDDWILPAPQYMLDLLLPSFPDKFVRKRAVEIISNGSSEFLISLISQFLEALRFEIYEDSDLSKFLLERATKDRRFATTLYWELNHRVMSQVPPYSTRCGYLLSVIERLKIPNFREEIACQQKFMQLLDGLSDTAKNMPPSAVTRHVQSELNYINDKFMITGLRLPIHPGFFCTSINIENCGVFNSLTKPVRLDLVGLRTNFGIIYKSGDDLRQDAVVLQIVRLMNDLWLREHLDLRMLTYRVLPTGKNIGLIELVTKCKTLREVQTNMSDRATDVFKDNSIATWIGRHNASEFEYRIAFDNFIRSCAGWCVATFILGIGDRHNDNILISESGHTFHIDFGKYMGDNQTSMGFNRDRVPFVLTPEMVFAINNGAKISTERFQLFSDYCCKAYNILRQNCGLLLNIIRFMSCSSIPFMDINSVNFVHTNLMLDRSEHEAFTFFTDMIRKSVNSSFPRLNFLAHTVAQKISGSTAGPSQEQNHGCFSFTKETYNAKTDGKIKHVQVSGFEKWRSPTKVYMYVFKVFRQNEKLPSTVYRAFDEVHELYRFLAQRFSEPALPVFDASGGFGRTQIKTVAQQRQVMLQNFFSRFFQLALEITQSDVVYTFFHAIHRDTNPEFIKDVINPNQLNTEPPRIHLSLSTTENSRTLKIFISHARNLPLINGVTTSPPDTYVKTKLNPDHQNNSKRKTSVIKNTCNPTYNAHIEYIFDSVEHMKRANIDLCIWQSSSAIVRDNYKICQTIVHCSKLFENQPDRKGGRSFAQWFTLTTTL